MLPPALLIHFAGVKPAAVVGRDDGVLGGARLFVAYPFFAVDASVSTVDFYAVFTTFRVVNLE